MADVSASLGVLLGFRGLENGRWGPGQVVKSRPKDGLVFIGSRMA